jgi:hypothetical protein
MNYTGKINDVRHHGGRDVPRAIRDRTTSANPEIYVGFNAGVIRCGTRTSSDPPASALGVQPRPTTPKRLATKIPFAFHVDYTW